MMQRSMELGLLLRQSLPINVIRVASLSMSCMIFRGSLGTTNGNKFLIILAGTKVLELARVAAPVRVGRVPGHSGLLENEITDRLARRELKLPDNAMTTHDRMTLASSGRQARELARKMLTDWWHSNRPKRYDNLEHQMRRKKPPELALRRAV